MLLLSPSAYGLQKMLTMCSSSDNQNGLHFNVKKTWFIMFHHKQCVDNNIELTLNGDILTWSHDITHLGHPFNCCLSFRKYIDIRKGCFIQRVNEICTHIIKLMDGLVIYLISTFVHGFVFKTYTPLTTFRSL